MTAARLSFHFLRFAILAIVTVAVIFVVGVFAVVPGERHAAAALPIVSSDEEARTLAAMKPPKRARPIIAIIGANDGTETTDYLVPYGVLKRSGVADVYALGTRGGAMTLMPALSVVPDATVAEFVARYPTGADYVIVPAMHDPTDAAVRDFIRAQAAGGATIVSICDGTLVMANAGLLDGRKATGHWFKIAEVARAHPTMHWVRDRRYVADRGVVTSTGISSSIPVSLALVEAIAGPERAEALANEIGARGWQVTHDSGAFHLIRDDVWMVLGNMAAGFLHRDVVGVRMNEGADLIALAFTADTYSRTFRSRAVVIGAQPITSAEGLRVLPDQRATPDLVVELPSAQPAHALDTAIGGIEVRYGKPTAAFVRVQLEDRGHTTGG
jgi:putative intracellular protease/amidase